MPDEHKIIDFPPSSYLSPEETLAGASRMDWAHVVIVGYDEDGKLMQRTSRMSRQDILWIIESLKRKLWEE